MRYLKPYKIFESKIDNDELSEYINSTLVDIDDLGLPYEVVLFNDENNTYYGRDNDQDLPITRVDIIISGIPNRTFDYLDISDVIDHINSYLSDMGFEQDPCSSSYGYYVYIKDDPESSEIERFLYTRERKTAYMAEIGKLKDTKNILNICISFLKTGSKLHGNKLKRMI